MIKRWQWAILGLFALISIVLYWALPIDGYLTLNLSEEEILPIWPKVTLHRNGDKTINVVLEDKSPWTHLLLEVDDGRGVLTEHGKRSADGVSWRWRWQIPENASSLRFYHDCQIGCVLWTTRELDSAESATVSSSVPTKLGVVLADPQRDWHGKQGWAVEITYAQTAEAEYWGIDDLALRVRKLTDQGVRVLIRVDYDKGQSLPLEGDEIALENYLRYFSRLSADDRFQNVHGIVIGSNYNASRGVTPEWYARIFNGYAGDMNERHAAAIIRANLPSAQLLVGPVSVWSEEQNGDYPFVGNRPWINYLNTVLGYIDQAAEMQARRGRPQMWADGVAIQAFGRVNGLKVPFQEPSTNQLDKGAQNGFRVYRDALTVVNQHPYTNGKPVYITATNTLDSKKSSTPSQNYPKGWLATALAEVNRQPQIAALCWFIDSFPYDDQWDEFSLQERKGNLKDAADEFDRLLQR